MYILTARDTEKTKILKEPKYKTNIQKKFSFKKLKNYNYYFYQQKAILEEFKKFELPQGVTYDTGVRTIR